MQQRHQPPSELLSWLSGVAISHSTDSDKQQRVCMSQISPYLGNTDKSFPRQGNLNQVLDWHTVANFNRITNTRVPHKVGYKTLEMKLSSTADFTPLHKPADFSSYFTTETMSLSSLKICFLSSKFVHLFIHILQSLGVNFVVEG